MERHICGGAMFVHSRVCNRLGIYRTCYHDAMCRVLQKVSLPVPYLSPKK